MSIQWQEPKTVPSSLGARRLWLDASGRWEVSCFVEATGAYVAVDREARRAIGTRPSLGGAQRLCLAQARGETINAEEETIMAKKKTTKPVRGTKGAKSETPKRERKKAEAPAGGKLSALDAAAKVLAEAGGPLNAKEMVERMAAAGYWTSPGGKTPHATLYSAILREIQTKGSESRFLKADRGKFALSA